MKISYVIYTYNGIHDALIQMEVIRLLWGKLFEKINIIHVYNGEEKWYKDKYLEDTLIRMDNPGHYEGAANLIDTGIKEALKTDCDYVVVSAADTWLLDIQFAEKILTKMKNEEKVLFTCPWGTPSYNNPQEVGFATDFFIIDANWEQKNKIFPFNYSEFRDKYIDLIRYLGKSNVMVEKLLFGRYLTACKNNITENQLKGYAISKLLIFEERLPVHTNDERNRRMEWEEISFYTNHSLIEKQEMLIRNKIELGKYTKMLKEGQIIDNTNLIYNP